ncbi:MAG: glycoside hydrolase family 130 protein [Vulcanimicrobiaceae bacterium]
MPYRSSAGSARYHCCLRCPHSYAGIIVHDSEHIDQVVYRSPDPLFVPEIPDEIYGTVGNVVFPTAIDACQNSGGRAFDIYYGMADYQIGRGRLTLLA